MEENFWKKCSSCKKEIPYNSLYWICNVSTCNRNRTALSFCSVNCWDAHLAIVRHRDTWAVEHRSPTKEFWAKVEAGEAEWSTLPKEEKEEVVVKNPQASGPKAFIRRSSGNK